MQAAVKNRECKEGPNLFGGDSGLLALSWLVAWRSFLDLLLNLRLSFHLTEYCRGIRRSRWRRWEESASPAGSSLSFNDSAPENLADSASLQGLEMAQERCARAWAKCASASERLDALPRAPKLQDISAPWNATTRALRPPLWKAICLCSLEGA